jgi:N12 class adenine-specific DNA methylase
MAAFEKIATRDTQKLYMEEQLEALDKELDQHRDRRRDMTVKRLEKMKIRLEEKYKELLKTIKDDGLVFERTGINALVVDELHLFKNLMTPSAIQGIAISGSNRATDLHLKLWLLERAQGSRQRPGFS